MKISFPLIKKHIYKEDKQTQKWTVQESPVNTWNDGFSLQECEDKRKWSKIVCFNCSAHFVLSEARLVLKVFVSEVLK